jgi:hypothetical protein
MAAAVGSDGRCAPVVCPEIPVSALCTSKDYMFLFFSVQQELLAFNTDSESMFKSPSPLETTLARPIETCIRADFLSTMGSRLKTFCLCAQADPFSDFFAVFHSLPKYVPFTEKLRELGRVSTPSCPRLYCPFPCAVRLQKEAVPTYTAESWKGPGTAKYDSSPVDFM